MARAAPKSRPPGRPGASVIVPAHNAEATLAETLESLRGQTQPSWEAIVVDDGSMDGTAEVAARFCETDNRIRLARQPRAGVSNARNAGIRLAGFDWLLFLDADDWIRPTALECLTDAIHAEPGVDAVYSAWARVTPDGAPAGRHFEARPDDLFSITTRHACLLHASLVRELGGFDTSLRNCADWDLWQRVARRGASFTGVSDVLALYRMRPDSSSANGFALIADGLRVIARGHRADPRVTDPHPAHGEGAPAEDLTRARIGFVCWAAGLVIGRGGDARPLLNSIEHEREPALDRSEVAETLFESVALGALRGPAAWPELWPVAESRLDEFLLALERRAEAPGLARRTRRRLEQMAVDRAGARRPFGVGRIYAVTIEITAPIPDVEPPSAAEQLDCRVQLQGAGIGTLELPVGDRPIPGVTIADAISAEFHWPILGRFFENTVYRELRVDRASDRLSLVRGELVLLTTADEDERTLWQRAHDEVGWTIFLQELWGHPEWPVERFYDVEAAEVAGTSLPLARDGLLTLEASQALPDVEPAGAGNIMLTVGGAPVGQVPVHGDTARLSAGRLRALLTTTIGVELSRVAVREALIGCSLEDPTSLRARLSAAARAAGSAR